MGNSPESGWDRGTEGCQCSPPGLLAWPSAAACPWACCPAWPGPGVAGPGKPGGERRTGGEAASPLDPGYSPLLTGVVI